ncbi:MAG: glycerophosphodiester phosphodiesterase [Rhodocyclaceae bacterium]|mgnify:CR=1 FL=1|nr:MAG: glycerophosphodiester phosphodiesterase [Rhodocyclaceae bacterium]MCK6383029.1 glycerophosphodiester phosphodiesterase [Rhodocyclaceae bacterium]CAG0933691.1 glycerophosphoryl diester phosphodiesterase [Rhodocyclaceae bacterium]
MSWAHPRLIAHRCGGALAPENTLAGLRKAAEHGYRAVEFDVMLSGDGTPVLMHDETLERTTDGHGRVAETSDAELARLDAGSRHGAQFAGEPVPTFGAAAGLCLALGLWANIEIKPSRGADAETARKVAARARELWNGSASPLLSSFSVAALEAARETAPELPRGLLVEKPPPDWPKLLHRLGCATLHCARRHAGRRLIEEAGREGVPLLVYTVNDAEDAATLLRQGVAAVFTDRIDLLAEPS